MSQVIVMPDAVEVLLGLLRSEQATYPDLDGITFTAKLPAADAPIGRAVCLRRVGGGVVNIVTDRARVAVTVWHDDEHSAMAAAQVVRALLAAAPGQVVGGVVISGYQETAGPGLRPDPVDPSRETVSFTSTLSLRGTPA